MKTPSLPIFLATLISNYSKKFYSCQAVEDGIHFLNISLSSSSLGVKIVSNRPSFFLAEPFCKCLYKVAHRILYFLLDAVIEDVWASRIGFIKFSSVHEARWILRLYLYTILEKLTDKWNSNLLLKENVKPNAMLNLIYIILCPFQKNKYLKRKRAKRTVSVLPGFFLPAGYIILNNTQPNIEIN